MDTIEESLRQRISERGERFVELCEDAGPERHDMDAGRKAGEAGVSRTVADAETLTTRRQSGAEGPSGARLQAERPGGGLTDNVADSWSALLSGRNAVMLALVSAGIGLHAFNSFAIVAAMPLAAEELGGTSLFSWAYSLYFIGSIAGGTGAAAFRDRIGPSAALLVSCLVFALGGLAALMAPSFGFILAGRLLQGIADGLIVAIAYSLIPGNFRPGLISKVFAAEAMVWAIASLLGPLAGGLLAEAFSWRISFLAVLPFLFLLVLLTPIARPAPSVGTRAAAAPFAIAMLIAGALVMSLSSVASSGLWQAMAVIAGVGLFVLATVFDGRIGPRLMPEGAFGHASVFGCGLWVLLLMSLSHSVGAVYLALAVSEIWNYRPIIVGAIVLLMALTWSVVAVLASRHPSPDLQDRRTRMGPLFQLAGFVTIAIGLIFSTIVLVVLGQILIGAGFGLAWANVNRAALAGASDEDRDRAGALLPTVSTAGYAIGAGLAGLVATATGLVGNLEGSDADLSILVPLFWMYGLAALGAVLALLFSRRVTLPR